MRHRGLDEADIRRRIASQIDEATRLRAADIILDNNGMEAHLRNQVAKLIGKI